jgi:hypothetical protein
MENLEFITERKTSQYNNMNLPTIRIDERGFYLSLSACNKYDIEAGMYLHMATTKDRAGHITGWFFVVNKTKKDGHKVSAANHGAALVLSRPLSRLFRMESGKNVGDTFYLHDTNSTFNLHPVIEILTAKTVDKIKTA